MHSSRGETGLYVRPGLKDVFLPIRDTFFDTAIGFNGVVFFWLWEWNLTQVNPREQTFTIISKKPDNLGFILKAALP